jgi:hypothetical protein
MLQSPNFRKFFNAISLAMAPKTTEKSTFNNVRYVHKYIFIKFRIKID